MSLFEVIQFEGKPNQDWLVFKYSNENIKTGSTLIVGQGQVAVFVKSGVVADCFSSGRYKLITANLPLLNRIQTVPTGGRTTFPAEVYFINTIHKFDLLWGTNSPCQIIDPKFGILVNVRAFGTVGMRISEPKALTAKVIGTIDKGLFVNYQQLIEYFKGLLITEIKTLISKSIIEDKVSCFEISAKLKDLSLIIERNIKNYFSSFGIELINFYINSINVPHEDLEIVKKALAENASMNIIGDSRYAMKRNFDVLEGAANNQNGTAGVFAAGGIGLGMGVNMAHSAFQMTNNMNQNPQVLGNYCNETNSNCQQYKFCSKCGTKLSVDSLFCPSCGQKL